MSAVLAGASAVFTYQGASVTLACSSPEELKSALATFGIGQAANDSPAPGKSPTGATAPAGANAASTTASSAAPVAAPAAQGDAGNARAAAPQGGSSAPTASSEKPTESPAVSFDELKKAFLDLSTKPGGREKCEAVLKAVEPVPAKLSAATPEQYPALMAAIKQQAGE